MWCSPRRRSARCGRWCSRWRCRRDDRIVWWTSETARGGPPRCRPASRLPARARRRRRRRRATEHSAARSAAPWRRLGRRQAPFRPHPDRARTPGDAGGARSGRTRSPTALGPRAWRAARCDSRRLQLAEIAVVAERADGGADGGVDQARRWRGRRRSEAASARASNGLTGSVCLPPALSRMKSSLSCRETCCRCGRPPPARRRPRWSPPTAGEELRDRHHRGRTRAPGTATGTCRMRCPSRPAGDGHRRRRAWRSRPAGSLAGRRVREPRWCGGRPRVTVQLPPAPERMRR